MGEDDTESMLMMETVEEPEEPAIGGVPGVPQEPGVPTAPPKKAPPNFNPSLKKKKRHGSSNKAPLPNKPQDLQVCECVFACVRACYYFVIFIDRISYCNLSLRNLAVLFRGNDVYLSLYLKCQLNDKYILLL